MGVLDVRQEFDNLSVRDLLAARDLYHNHLVHKQNVVGTAIGRYLIREGDPRKGEHKGAVAKPRAPKEERRFDNSEVRDYSWPCVLVLVDKWEESTAFGGKGAAISAHDMVPKTLYLPDGRTVPVCVVRVIRETVKASALPHWIWPESLFGGGMPLVVDSQGIERVASAGCLVSDGHTVYVLTNRHVGGAPGQPVFTFESGRRTLIGRASDKQLTRRRFDEVYSDYAGHRTWINLDVGLVELDDLTAWTSQIYGLGPIGPLADLSELNISLRLIDAPVVAYGAASGHLEGRIKALFHRYRSVGGFEYVADFLIAPEMNSPLQTQPGDSGTIWHLRTPDEPDELRPLAIEWGGQTFAEGASNKSSNFALATSLSNVCKLLDVELVLEHNIGVAPFWGQMGHYSIGSFACDFAESAGLSTLMKANRDRISFEIAGLAPKDIAAAIKAAKSEEGFIPLADVPDLVWKTMKGKKPGGRDTKFSGQGRTSGPEHPTHYADIDETRADGKNLRELCLEDPANVSVEFWKDFYSAVGHNDSSKRGLLPFRVWQFFDVMAAAVRARELDKFVCAAGLVSHYVGDACQSLHGSKLADGYSDQPVSVEHTRRETGEVYETESHVGAGVHSAFETNMVDRFASEIVSGLKRAVAKAPKPPKLVNSGQEAAVAVVALMDRVAKRLPPEDIVKVFLEAGGKKNVAAYDALWDAFGDGTIEAIVDGSRVLAMIWDSAWAAGDGDKIAKAKLDAIPCAKLQELYEDPGFVPSLDLDPKQACSETT